MPTPAQQRQISDVCHEIRIIRALFPQQCLDQSRQPLSRAKAPGPPSSSCTYQNTGVQTLPPPNGDIFNLIYGREPSQADYVRNTGTAALGHFAADPRSNPFELIYGAAYPAPVIREGKSYADTGFQTADCEMTRKALARAKAKASIMVSRYREVARQVGYKVIAESKDEMVAHSEQFLSVVRLGADGNLLEGTADSLYLPNIRGTPIQSQSWTPLGTPQDTHTAHCDIIHKDSQMLSGGPAPYAPASSSNIPIPQRTSIEPPAKVAALAPFSEETAYETTQFCDDEFDTVESDTNGFVIYDAGTKQQLPSTMPTSAEGLPKLSMTERVDSTEVLRSCPKPDHKGRRETNRSPLKRKLSFEKQNTRLSGHQRRSGNDDRARGDPDNFESQSNTGNPLIDVRGLLSSSLKRQALGTTSVDQQVTSDPAKKNGTSRKRGRPFTPYVPPAMRAKILQYNDDKTCNEDRRKESRRDT